MSKIVIIGYGYMGNLYRETFSSLGYSDISIIDPKKNIRDGFYNDLYEFGEALLRNSMELKQEPTI
ncbi:hypothetical protein APQ14_14660 [Vibrio toranzoniae]|uniref:Uncharacterized protein n=1 Tax=Vibrio toranzoniae TaxID=1194427 RepID=A0A109D6N9_9VIBR|nr:hypothetical protein APQ14_14660 [Vibrio toranzoniae]SBS29682.1 hypothetical protein VTO7225_01055 [Vibrio toranzoniae]